MGDFVSGVGPLFGPNFVVVTVDDDSGKRYDVQVYPDAHNPELRAAGQPTQYYFQPSQVYLARKHDSPDDFDFQMTVFKGLLSAEDTIAPADLAGTEVGGGFCTFSTTFAIPPEVIDRVLEKLTTREHGDPGQRLGPFFNFQNNDPSPVLGIVPITNSSVVCSVADPAIVGNFLKMSAQYSGKGSIEQKGITTFLLTCNTVAAGVIASSLKQGASPPFTVANTLQEMFYINGVTVDVTVDVDKVYDSFSAAVSVGSLFGITAVEADFAYSNCITSGAITTHITQNGAVLDPETKKWVDQNIEVMRKTAMDLVKQEIFDWDPSKNDSRASADRSWVSEVFGGASVSLKSTYEKRSIKLNQQLVLDTTYAASHTVTGDLNDLLPAVTANLNKYLFIADVGEFFKKVQVAARSEIDFTTELLDGTDLRDPVKSAQIEVGYPKFPGTIGPDGKPVESVLGSGKQYVRGSATPIAAEQPAIFKADNAENYFNIAHLRLDNELPGWPSGQVRLRRKIVFDGRDPRVRLTSAIAPHDPAIAEWEELTTDLKPILTANAVGYIFIRFWVNKHPLPSCVTVTITPSIGGDTFLPIVVTKDNGKDALWEVFSDKYVREEEFTYTLEVQVDGPNFTDDSVVYASPEPITVEIPPGIATYNPKLNVRLPDVPDDQEELVNTYIKAASGLLVPP